ncbi:META domain-containing protein [Spirosoma sp. BT702]|uniref:META domain-containing protein n=1 Tax=Spirosoma profusum TaxID=2771354 RepID=A0A926XZR2_9BACT|nr:META domain-containing protein [Spirosoma profusum]MBD2699275.1 META domain-containing protein [Spirosoma profusum]
MRTILFGLLLLTAACRRPSTRFASMLTPAPPPADYSQYLKSGDELVAFGNDPAWTLTVNPSKGTLRFKAPGKDSLEITAPERQNDSDGVLRYNIPVDAGHMNVLFRPDSCVDKKTGYRLDYRVEIDLRGKNYVGCGVSLRQLTTLQDIWVLTEFQGKPVSAGGPRNELPRLEISLTEGRVTGTTGCNQLSGEITADTHQILFGPLITTKMACMGTAGEFEKTFLNALATPLTYQIGQGKLMMLRSGTSIMAFKKVD